MADNTPAQEPDASSQQKTSGFAIASLVLGILSLVLGWIPFVGWIIIILAVVLGILGIRDAKEGKSGNGFAIAGIVLAIIGAIIAIFVLTLIIYAGTSYNATYNTNSVLPGRCILGQEFNCTNYQIRTTGAGGDLWVNASFTNVLGTPVTYTGGTASMTGYGNGTCVSTTQTIPYQGAFQMNCDLKPNPGTAWPAAGQKAKLEIDIGYKEAGKSFPHSVVGEIFGTIQ